MSSKEEKSCDIAVVGVGSIFPGATNKNEFWNDIYLGIDRITDVPKTHWNVEEYFSPNPNERDKTYAKRGGFLPFVEFNPLDFGIPPNSLTATDTGQILALLVAKQTLEDYADEKDDLKVSRERVSVILGTTGATELITDMASRMERPKWFKAMLEEGVSKELAETISQKVSTLYPEWQESTFPGLLSNVIAGRIANRLNLKGTNFVADAACASSLAALQFSINQLVLNQSDLVITGGVDTLNTIFMYMCFSKTPALSKSGSCKPFSHDSDGTLIGEGIGMVALKRLADAEAHGDKIYAVIKGLGSSSDGIGKSIYAPSSEGQSRALKKTYEAAHYSPHTVELVEAHGTGTKAGDLCELESLHSVFHSESKSKFCALGSIKSQIGHTKAAAGIAGLLKTVFALHHKVLPPTIKVERPHSILQSPKSPFYINTESKPWVRDTSHPRRASVSSFGFGGSNFHVTLEEYKGRNKRKKIRSFSSNFYLFASQTKQGLLEQLSVLSETAQYTPHHKCRLAIVVKDRKELVGKLERARQLLLGNERSFSKEGIYFSSDAIPGKIAFLFPGQGSQYTGMGSQLARSFDAAREVWDEVADVKLEGTEEKLHQIVFPPSFFSEEEKNSHTEKLKQTEWAQTAISVCSISFLKLLRDFFGINADYYLGHSLGSLTALSASGAFSFKDLVRFSRRRGLLMSQKGDKNSGMLAVGASHVICEPLVYEKKRVCVANMNSPDQTVLSGNLEDLKEIAESLSKKKINSRFIPVSAAFHSSKMESVHKDFFSYINNISFNDLKTPVVSCMDLKEVSRETLAKTLADEITAPVKFMPAILDLYKKGVRVFIEVGPKSVLTKLSRRILREQQDVLILAIDENELDSVYGLWNLLAQIFVAGVNIDLKKFYEEFEAEKEKLQKNASFGVQINGANLRPHGDSKALALEKTISPANNQENYKERASMDSRKPIHHISQDSFVSRFELAKQLQIETARLHSEFQKTLKDTHLAYIKSSEQCFSMLLGSLESPQQNEWSWNDHKADISEKKQKEIYLSSPAKTETFEEAAPENDSFVFSNLSASSTHEVKASEPVHIPVLKAETVVEAPVKVERVESKSPSEEIILNVIGEKTGYPLELLRVDMSLDTDLGIDSIKRVEIFSQLAEKIPEAASIEPQVMNKLVTIEEIVNFFDGRENSQLAKKKLLQSFPTLSV